MGDFDKQQTPNANAEKKKMMLVAILGAILLGVVGFHFLKGGPQSADASALLPTADPAAPIVADETPAQAQASLADDPTAKLLRGSPNPDSSLDKAPHDPFVMATEWQSSLIRAIVAKPQSHSVEPVAIAAVPQAVSLEGLKLTGIFQQDKNLCAIINGRMLVAGMILDDVKVIDITHDRVTLQRVDSPTGPKATLTIEPKLQ